MDELGNRIIKDTAEIQAKLDKAFELEKQVIILRQEAGELERLLELARFQK